MSGISNTTKLLSMRVPNATHDALDEAAALAELPNRSDLVRIILTPWLQTFAGIVEGNEFELPDLTASWALISTMEKNKTGQTRLQLET